MVPRDPSHPQRPRPRDRGRGIAVVLKREWKPGPPLSQSGFGNDGLGAGEILIGGKVVPIAIFRAASISTWTRQGSSRVLMPIGRTLLPALQPRSTEVERQDNKNRSQPSPSHLRGYVSGLKHARVPRVKNKASDLSATRI